MDGRGRFLDNIFIERLWRSLKHEDVYLKHYADGREARAGLASWIAFYNSRRPHQALGYKTPMSVWRVGTTGALDEKAVDMTLRFGGSSWLASVDCLSSPGARSKRASSSSLASWTVESWVNFSERRSLSDSPLLRRLVK